MLKVPVSNFLYFLKILLSVNCLDFFILKFKMWSNWCDKIAFFLSHFVSNCYVPCKENNSCFLRLKGRLLIERFYICWSFFVFFFSSKCWRSNTLVNSSNFSLKIGWLLLISLMFILSNQIFRANLLTSSTTFSIFSNLSKLCTNFCI